VKQSDSNSLFEAVDISLYTTEHINIKVKAEVLDDVYRIGYRWPLFISFERHYSPPAAQTNRVYVLKDCLSIIRMATERSYLFRNEVAERSYCFMNEQSTMH